MKSVFTADTFLREALEKRSAEHALRELRQTNQLIDFSSNDYYGLARSAVLHEWIEKASHGLNNGSGGSRLLSGNSALIEETERELAQCFKAETALLFQSGYAANVGFFQALANRTTTILYDELIHASVRDGIRLSNAKAYRFKHNDVAQLKALLDRTEGLVYVAVEAVYSMDGDYTPLTEIVDCCEKAGANLVLDEAHSTSVFWPGMAVALGLEQQIFARLHTFGKAVGVHGAAWLGSDLLRKYLINFSRAFIYTTALTPHSVVSIREACRYVDQHPELIHELKSRIAFFQERAATYTTLQFIPSDTAIQALLVPGNDRARKIAAHLQEAGFDARPVLAPTVPVGTERIRICLHVHNTPEEIKHLLHTLAYAVQLHFE